MKKSLIVITVLSLVVVYPLNAQGLLNKVKNAVAKEILGPDEQAGVKNASKPGPEPACACDDAKLVVDLSQFKIDYNEIAVSMKDDGSILVKDRIGGKAYIIKDGSTQGPFETDDPRVTSFDVAPREAGSNDRTPAWATKFPGYISLSGEKYLIKFNGNSYGPYALINDFAVSRAKTSFAAIVTKEVLATDEMNKKMEADMAKAKTDQEKMDLTIKYSQQVSDRMLQAGADPESFQPQLVSNVPGAIYDMIKWMGGSLNSKIKFDDIVVRAPDKILDLKGNTLITVSSNQYSSEELFLNSSNDKSATYNYGRLTFSDNSTLSELFNPQLVKTGGKVYLAYMYYSPGKNAIMQCSMPF